MKYHRKPEFEPCPDYEGKAVCVDVTELQVMRSQYGEQEKFMIVFELDLPREDPPENTCTNWCIWTVPFTPSVGDKSNFKKFLCQWYGRTLTPEELDNLDSEDLIGRPAVVTVSQEEDEAGKVRGRLIACRPDRTAEPMEASGTFTRKKDRPDKDEPKGGAGAAYKRAAKTNAPPKPPTKTSPGAAALDPAGVIIHVGKSKGIELGQLERGVIEKLITNWYEGDFANIAKPTADDVRLFTALRHYKKKFAAAPPKPEPEPEPVPEPETDY